MWEEISSQNCILALLRVRMWEKHKNLPSIDITDEFTESQTINPVNFTRNVILLFIHFCRAPIPELDILEMIFTDKCFHGKKHPFY